MRTERVDTTGDETEGCQYIVEGDETWTHAEDVMFMAMSDGSLVVAIQDEKGRRAAIAMRGERSLKALSGAIREAQRGASEPQWAQRPMGMAN